MLRYKAPETVCGIVRPDRKRRGDEPDHDACRTSQYKSGYVYDGIYRKQSDKGNPGSHGNAEGISL